MAAMGSQRARATPATRGHNARRVREASTRARRDLAIVQAARLIPIRLLRAMQSRFALATPDIQVSMTAHARRAAQASTRMYRELTAAAAARQTRAHLSRAQL